MTSKIRQLRQAIKTEVRWVCVKARVILPKIPYISYLYISPFYVLFAVFWLFPITYLVYLSFFEYIGPGEGMLIAFDFWSFSVGIPRISNLQFVGFRNYQNLFTDELLIKAVQNTVVIAIIEIPLMVGTALLTALVLNKRFIMFSKHFRTLIALPVSANIVAYSSVFLLLFAEKFGFINYLLNAFGLPMIPWQTDGVWAKLSIVTALNWRWMGYNMLILFAGLQSIDHTLYEAAEIDGATWWQKFWYITLPQIRPVLLFVIILSTISGLRLFTEPWIITEGGPGNETLTIMMYIYQQAFRFFNLGYASAITCVLVIAVTTLAIIELRYGGHQT